MGDVVRQRWKGNEMKGETNLTEWPEWYSPEMVQISDYECLFWAALLGTIAWRVVEIVRAGDKRSEKAGWTFRRRWSAPVLAAQVPCGKQALIGVNRNVEGVLTRRPGAFDALMAEGVADIQRRGTGAQVEYEIRVRSELPPLRPDQAEGLSPQVQDIHTRWLQEYGFDTDLWRLMEKETGG